MKATGKTQVNPPSPFTGLSAPSALLTLVEVMGKVARGWTVGLDTKHAATVFTTRARDLSSRRKTLVIAWDDGAGKSQSYRKSKGELRFSPVSFSAHTGNY
ncbi:hypothetical protein BaRGS_00008473 [Batillaria attramentaria]|uniref:Uncharacterized protein n=1 Tax=Batillaria attramentaria TaxID=370345 RepID=A0ABD0LLQ2_9CAEN